MQAQFLLLLYLAFTYCFFVVILSFQSIFCDTCLCTLIAFLFLGTYVGLAFCQYFRLTFFSDSLISMHMLFLRHCFCIFLVVMVIIGVFFKV